jgi:L-iditol 2-dehydrogenase
MRAVQVIGDSELNVTDVAEPGPGRGALLKVNTVGICGTDVKVFKGHIPTNRPLTMGHEGICTVVEPGDLGITSAGMRVLVDPAIACGYCEMCRAGRVHICRNGGLMGRDDDGVFSEYVRVPEERLLPVPDTITETASGILQVLGTAVHAQRAVDVFPGDVVVVVGLGVAGLLMVQLLKQRGATVIGVNRAEWKRHLAAEMGADAIAAPDEAKDLVMEMTDGRGADLGLEAAGVEHTLAQTIDLTKIGGEILVFGTLTGAKEGLPYYQFYFKELTIYNPRAAQPTDYERGIRLVASGALEVEKIVTHRFSLEEATGAFEAVQESSSLKVLMSVGD